MGAHRVIIEGNRAGGDPYALGIEVREDGRLLIGGWAEDKWDRGSPVPITAEQLARVPSLGYGESMWLPTGTEPAMRVTGEGSAIEVTMNAPGFEPASFELAQIAETVARLLGNSSAA